MRGHDETDGIWGAQAHWPAYMAANHKQALASYQFQGVLPQITKEAMHVAVSMSNGCEYWLSVHTSAVLRLGTSDKGLTEILAVAEHVNSMAALADGFRLRPDVPRPAAGEATELVTPLDEAEPGPASDTLEEIRAWAQSALGIEHVPAFWRVLARQPRFLTSTWAKNCLVLSSGDLDEATKACTALAVAMNGHSAYFTPYLKPWVQRVAGLDDDGLVELGAAVMHYVSFNTIAHGMLLAPPFVDVRAEDFRPGGQLADAPGAGAPPRPQ